LKKKVNNVELLPIIKCQGEKRDEIRMFKKSYTKWLQYIYWDIYRWWFSIFNLKSKMTVITDIQPELIDLYSCIKKGQINEIYNFME